MKDFSPKQEKLLAALLSEKDLRAASNKAGLGETTAWRYLQDADFIAEYRRLRRDSVEQAISQLQRSTTSAVEALQKNLTCGHPPTEVSAAKTILDFALKGVELSDLQTQIEEIKDAINQK